MHHTWRLTHFLAIAETGSVQAAARHLNISQPAITKSIRLLEDHLGASLFDRSPSGMMMTEAGRALRARARNIELEWNAALSDLDAGKRGTRGLLRLGVGPTYATLFLPAVLSELSARFPNVEFEVRTGVGSELLPALQSGEISVYVGGLEADIIGRRNDILERPIYTQFNDLAVKDTHPILDHPAKDIPSALRTHPWVRLSYDRVAHQAVQRFFAQYEMAPPDYTVTTGSLSVALNLVMEQGFVTSLPRPLFGLGMAPVSAANYAWSIPTGVTYRSSIRDTAPFLAFMEALLRKTAQAGLAM
jgi:DNA-binding transcriptional LysR family regulator